MLNLSIAISLLTLFFLISPLKAANPSVSINEIAWMGTEKGSSDEWMELYNNTDKDIDLVHWILKSASDNLKISLKGVILKNGFYLLERTDDNTLPNLKADFIYSGSLKNEGDKLELYDGLNNLIDSVNGLNGWPAGNNSTKQTMERVDLNNWQNSQNPGGTPKSKNSVVVYSIAQTENPVKGNTPSLEEKVIINEVLPSPQGKDEEEEWIELYNPNNSGVDLSDWKITDLIGTTKTYNFPKGIKISANGFLILKRQETKITLNNQEDGLNLINPDGKIIDSVNYKKAVRGNSYSRFGSKWSWSNNLTPGNPNILASLTENSATKTQGQANVVQNSEAKNAENGNSNEKFSANISQSTKENKNENKPKNLIVYLIGLATALSSGIIILTLKKQLKSS